MHLLTGCPRPHLVKLILRLPVGQGPSQALAVIVGVLPGGLVVIEQIVHAGRGRPAASVGADPHCPGGGSALALGTVGKGEADWKTVKSNIVLVYCRRRFGKLLLKKLDMGIRECHWHSKQLASNPDNFVLWALSSKDLKSTSLKVQYLQRILL